MAVERGSEYTVDELYDNYEFKVVKRALMKEFPWIKNISVTQENLDKYGIIFLDFEVDLPQLLQTYDWTPYFGAQRAWDNNQYFHAMYLSLFGDIGYTEGKDVANDIERVFNAVHESPALPKDLRLKTGRKFAVGDYYFNPGQPQW